MYKIKEKIILSVVVVIVSIMFLLSIGLLIQYGNELAKDIAIGLFNLSSKGF